MAQNKKSSPLETPEEKRGEEISSAVAARGKETARKTRAKKAEPGEAPESGIKKAVGEPAVKKQQKTRGAAPAAETVEKPAVEKEKPEIKQRAPKAAAEKPKVSKKAPAEMPVEKAVVPAMEKVEEKAAPGLKEKYLREIAPLMMKEFKYRSIMEVPRFKKIVLNIGMGEATANPKALESAQKDLAAIAGQYPVITRAKISISAFKLRKGMPIGLMVTLRGKRLWDFLNKLMNAVLPRIRDFQGVSPKSFDKEGNYTLGVKEQIIFPEIEYDKVDKIRGLQISFVTTARKVEEGKKLLELMGMPFARS